jgi:quinol monooxygenase YgiN
MREEVLRAFRANVPAVLAEDGCIEYGAVIDAAPAPAFHSPIGPDTFYVIEKWASLDALQAHATSAHMAAYGARTKDFIASRKVHVLNGI